MKSNLLMYVSEYNWLFQGALCKTIDTAQGLSGSAVEVEVIVSDDGSDGDGDDGDGEDGDGDDDGDRDRDGYGDGDGEGGVGMMMSSKHMTSLQPTESFLNSVNPDPQKPG